MPKTVVIVGLGEVGGVFAAELAELGLSVVVVDGRPHSDRTAAKAAELGLPIYPDASSVRDESGVVLSCVPARAALETAEYILLRISGGSLAYVDVSAKAPDVRDAVERRCAAVDVPFADVAICDPVTWRDAPVELITSGPASPLVEALFAGTRFRVQTASNVRCISSEIKLCRTTFTKGLSALLIETLAAAEALDAVETVWAGIARLLDSGAARLADLLVGTALQHGARRAEEADAAATLLAALLPMAPMATAASVVWADIADTGAQAGVPGALPWRAALHEISAHRPGAPMKPEQATGTGAAS